MLRRLATKFLVFDWIFGGIINRKFEYTKALDTFFFNLTEVKSWVEKAFSVLCDERDMAVDDGSMHIINEVTRNHTLNRLNNAHQLVPLTPGETRSH